METLEGKYVRLYEDEYDFVGRSRERRKARGRGEGAERRAEGGGWMGKRAEGTLSLTNVFGDA